MPREPWSVSGRRRRKRGVSPPSDSPRRELEPIASQASLSLTSNRDRLEPASIASGHGPEALAFARWFADWWLRRGRELTAADGRHDR